MVLRGQSKVMRHDRWIWQDKGYYLILTKVLFLEQSVQMPEMEGVELKIRGDEVETVIIDNF